MKRRKAINARADAPETFKEILCLLLILAIYLMVIGTPHVQAAVVYGDNQNPNCFDAYSKERAANMQPLWAPLEGQLPCSSPETV